MKHHRFGLLALLLFALGCSGCTMGPKPGGISVAALTLQLGPASSIEIRAPLLVRFTNENVIPLGYSKSSHKLYLDGTYIGKAVNDQPIGLPPLNEASREVFVQFENLPYVRQLAGGSSSRTVNYRLETVLYQTAGEDKLQIKVHSEGRLELLRSAD